MKEVEAFWFRILYAGWHSLICKPLTRSCRIGAIVQGATMGEIFTSAFLAFSLILVGLSVGFLMLKLQGGEE